MTCGVRRGQMKSSSSNTHSLVQQQEQQGRGRANWPRTGVAAYEETQLAVDTRPDSSRRSTNGAASNAEANYVADAEENVWLHL